MSDFKGNFSEINLAEVLRMLVSTKQNGLLRIYHGDEEGLLAVERGVVVNAATATQQGRHALYQFIVWRDANFRFEAQNIPPNAARDLAAYPAIQLIDGIARKIDELAALQQAVPTLDSVLYYTGGEALGDVEATPSELGLLILANGHNTVEQIARRANLNPLEVAKSLAKFRLAGVLELVSVPNRDSGPIDSPFAHPPPQPAAPAPEPPPAAPHHGEAPRYWRGKRIN